MALPELNLAALRREARKKSGVNSTDYANSQLDADLNDAYVTLSYFLAHLEEDYFEEQNASFDLLQNSGLYSLPRDFIAFKQLRLAYTTPSSPNDFVIAKSYQPNDTHNVSFDETSAPMTNPIVDLTAGYFRIQPKPTSPVTGGGRIFYIAMPSALANTGDVPVLPIPYHSMLATYAAKEMTFKYEKWKKHDRLEKTWNEKINELTQLLADRDRGAAMRMKSPAEVPSDRRGNVREL